MSKCLHSLTLGGGGGGGFGGFHGLGGGNGWHFRLLRHYTDNFLLKNNIVHYHYHYLFHYHYHILIIIIICLFIIIVIIFIIVQISFPPTDDTFAFDPHPPEYSIPRSAYHTPSHNPWNFCNFSTRLGTLWKEYFRHKFCCTISLCEG